VAHSDPVDRLVLASSSPQRRALLERVGMAVEIAPADVDETPLAGEEPVAYARRVARSKAAAVSPRAPGRWVLAADTVVEVDGQILGKPTGAGDAARMLGQLAGRSHRVITAFALRGPRGQEVVREVETEVWFRPALPDELAAYVRSGEWQGKAGGYAVQGIAAAFVAGVRGSFTNVVGLPLSEVVEELVRAGAPGPDYARGVPA
jgi:septum formation protein